MAARVTWIIVADGARAYVLANRGPGKGLTRIREMEGEGNKLSHEIGSDRPGRSHASASTNRSAMEWTTDPQRFAKQEFAHRVVKLLENSQRDFDRLVLAAPSKTLGDLRAAMNTRLRAKVIGELDKDLTYLPAHDLARQFAPILRL